MIRRHQFVQWLLITFLLKDSLFYMLRKGGDKHYGTVSDTDFREKTLIKQFPSSN